MNTEEVKEEVKNRYRNKLKHYFDLYTVNTDILVRTDKKKKEYCLGNIRTKDVYRALKEYVGENKHRVFYKLFGIDEKEIDFWVSFDGVPLSKDTYSPQHYELLYCDDLKLISSIETSEMYILKDGENLVPICNFHYELLAENSFKGSVLMKYSFDYVEEIDPWSIIEFSEQYLTCRTYALYKDENIELWKEYILNSFVFYETDNVRMAFFSAFAALDQCIEILYKCLYEVFESMLCYTLCVDVDMDAIRYIERGYEEYKKEEKRLIDEKLKNCLKVLSIGEDYSILLDNLRLFEKDRNSIAHCAISHEIKKEKYIDLVWTIIEFLGKVSGMNVVSLFHFEGESYQENG